MVRTCGVEGLQAYLRNHIQLGEEFAAWVSERPDLFTIVSGPAFAMTVLRLNPQVLNGSAGSHAAMLGDAMTKDAYEMVNAGGEIMLTSSVVGGRCVIRIVSGGPKTDREHLRKAYGILVEMAQTVGKDKVRYVGAVQP